MIFFPIVCLIVGVSLGLLVRTPIHGLAGAYIAVACLAGLDTLLGGIRSNIEGRFRNDIFVTGFFSNVIIASFLAWLGDRIGINIFLVCALIFGQRIFNNLSLLRRHALTKWQDSREKKRQAELQQQQQASVT